MLTHEEQILIGSLSTRYVGLKVTFSLPSISHLVHTRTSRCFSYHQCQMEQTCPRRGQPSRVISLEAVHIAPRRFDPSILRREIVQHSLVMLITFFLVEVSESHSQAY